MPLTICAAPRIGSGSPNLALHAASSSRSSSVIRFNMASRYHGGRQGSVKDCNFGALACIKVRGWPTTESTACFFGLGSAGWGSFRTRSRPCSAHGNGQRGGPVVPAGQSGSFSETSTSANIDRSRPPPKSSWAEATVRSISDPLAAAVVQPLCAPFRQQMAFTNSRKARVLAGACRRDGYRA